jgi:hypothetical protein
MTHRRRARVGIPGLVALALLAAGCGGKGGPTPIGTTGAKVRGRLLENGQPVKVRPGEDIVVSFAPPDLADVTSPRGAASIDPKDGSFAFFGPNSAAGLLSPGSYRVSISSVTGSGEDRFAATFSVGKSPLTAAVGPEPEQTFLIDLVKKTVQKQ